MRPLRKQHHSIAALVWSALIVAAVVPAAAAGSQFDVVGDSRTDSVTFKSTAKLEFIEGRTGNIRGRIECEPDSLRDIVAVLQVDLRTLKTGIDLRDEHMRENHLHTDKFPFAYFKLDSVQGLPATLAADTTYHCTGYGEFYIHGHRRAITADLRVRYSSDRGRTLDVTASFAMNLDQFKIDRPRALFLKLAETVLIDVYFTAAEGTSEKQPILPDWPLLE